MVLRIDPRDDQRIQAAILAVKTANRELRGNIRRFTKSELAPEWKTSVTQKASTSLERRVLASSAKATVSDQNLAVSAATSTKKLKGGLVPAKNPWGVEMGSTRSKQFKGRNSRGYVVKPLASEFVGRAVALWVSTIVRTYMEARDQSERG